MLVFQGVAGLPTFAHEGWAVRWLKGLFLCFHWYLYTYIHTYIHIYTYIYIHTYIHTYIHIYTYYRSVTIEAPCVKPQVSSNFSWGMLADFQFDINPWARKHPPKRPLKHGCCVELSEVELNDRRTNSFTDIYSKLWLFERVELSRIVLIWVHLCLTFLRF